jgi:hypothetical protein
MSSLGSVAFGGPVKNTPENSARGVIGDRVLGCFMSNDEE